MDLTTVIPAKVVVLLTRTQRPSRAEPKSISEHNVRPRAAIDLCEAVRDAPKEWRETRRGSQLTEGTAERRGQRSEELSRVGAGGAKETNCGSKHQESWGRESSHPRLRVGADG